MTANLASTSRFQEQPFAQQPFQQEQRTPTLHRSFEIKKWHGSSTTEDTSEGVEGDKHWIVHDNQPVKGSKIIQELLDHDIQLIPGTINAYMREGTALHWFREGKHNQKYNYSLHNFGSVDGSDEGKR
eukprot:2130965-Ditylum_brightwellii.AAC.1